MWGSSTSKHRVQIGQSTSRIFPWRPKPRLATPAPVKQNRITTIARMEYGGRPKWKSNSFRCNSSFQEMGGKGRGLLPKRSFFRLGYLKRNEKKRENTNHSTGAHRCADAHQRSREGVIHKEGNRCRSGLSSRRSNCTNAKKRLFPEKLNFSPEYRRSDARMAGLELKPTTFPAAPPFNATGVLIFSTSPCSRKAQES